MNASIFVDTNIFVYAYNDNDEKHEIAKTLLQQKLADKEVFISPQILSEFYVTMKRYKHEDVVIRRDISEIVQTATVTPLALSTIEHCFALKEKYAYSWWDSLVLASALESECGEVCSEDMQDGQVIEGSLTISNPFYRK
jgi:predicted nucleic acid-binding protein